MPTNDERARVYRARVNALAEESYAMVASTKRQARQASRMIQKHDGPIVIYHHLCTHACSGHWSICRGARMSACVHTYVRLGTLCCGLVVAIRSIDSSKYQIKCLGQS